MMVQDLGAPSEASGFTADQMELLNELQMQKEQFDKKHDERRGIDSQSNASGGGSSMLMQLRKHKK